jgi:hypothetical protein
MTSTRLKAGVYKVTEAGFTFTLTRQEKGWSLWNSIGTEIMRDSAKSGILRALQFYTAKELAELDTQEWTNK